MTDYKDYNKWENYEDVALNGASYIDLGKPKLNSLNSNSPENFNNGIRKKSIRKTIVIFTFSIILALILAFTFASYWDDVRWDMTGDLISGLNIGIEKQEALLDDALQNLDENPDLTEKTIEDLKKRILLFKQSNLELKNQILDLQDAIKNRGHGGSVITVYYEVS